MNSTDNPAVGSVTYDIQNNLPLGTSSSGDFKPLPGATAPTNPLNINQTAAPIITTPSNNTGNIAGASAATDASKTAIDTTIKQNGEDAKAKADALATDQSTTKSGILSIFNSQKDPATVRNDALTAAGQNPANYFADQQARITEIGSLTKSYNDIKAKMEYDTANLVGSGADLGFINSASSQINRDHAYQLSLLSSDINAKSATLQAIQGNFNQALTFAQQAVTDATTGTKQRLDALTSLYDMNKDAIDSLDSKYKDSLNYAISQAKTEHDDNVDNKKTVMELALKNPQANISINDTPEQAFAKVNANPNSPDNLLKQAQINSANRANQGGGGTLEERNQQIVNQVSSLFSPATSIPSGANKGKPFVDTNGFATPEGFKDALRASGLPRKDFIQQFGYLLYGGTDNTYSNYGLTPAETKLLTG